LNESFRRVIAKKLTLNCSWKDEDDSRMQDDAQTGALRRVFAPVRTVLSKRKSRPEKAGFSLPENSLSDQLGVGGT
jgi:hypothetical protein